MFCFLIGRPQLQVDDNYGFLHTTKFRRIMRGKGNTLFGSNGILFPPESKFINKISRFSAETYIC